MRLLRNDVLDERLRWLRSALNKLEGTEGRPRARRTARKRVLAGLRRVREQMDALFPAIVERTASRTRRTPYERFQKLTKLGWQSVSPETALKYAAAGVVLRHVKYKAPSDSNYIVRARLVPAWAAAIGPNKPSELRAAKKSRTLQKAALVAEALS